jgi:DNA-binding LytR/AlgR family response regulator
VDYLMKPIAADRLRVAVDRALERRRGTGDAPGNDAAMERMLDELATRPGHRTRFAVKVQNRFVIVDVAELSHIEAEGNYVRLHTSKDAYLYRTTMAALESSLDPSAFIRIHRSHILRIDKVSYIEGWAPGEYLFRLETGHELVSSRGYARQVRAVFGL